MPLRSLPRPDLPPVKPTSKGAGEAAGTFHFRDELTSAAIQKVTVFALPQPFQTTRGHLSQSTSFGSGYSI